MQAEKNKDTDVDEQLPHGAAKTKSCTAESISQTGDLIPAQQAKQVTCVDGETCSSRLYRKHMRNPVSTGNMEIKGTEEEIICFTFDYNCLIDNFDKVKSPGLTNY